MTTFTTLADLRGAIALAKESPDVCVLKWRDIELTMAVRPVIMTEEQMQPEQSQPDATADDFIGEYDTIDVAEAKAALKEAHGPSH